MLGDRAPLREIVDVKRRYGTSLLVDEAHSFLVAGAGGRGVCEEQGVLDQVDLLVITFSKGFGAVGGALAAQEAVEVRPDDTEASLHERIKTVERRLYVETINDILERGSVL